MVRLPLQEWNRGRKLRLLTEPEFFVLQGYFSHTLDRVIAREK
jgi:hypothetical protein